MGLLDMFASNPEGLITGLSALKDTQIGKLLGDGIMDKVQKMSDDISRPKPGKFCDKACNKAESLCPACLEIQYRTEVALKELEALEDAQELTMEQVQQKNATLKKGAGCSLCGAPFEKMVQVCPYCDTPYPEGRFDIELPVSKNERNTMYMKKAEEVLVIFNEKLELFLKDAQENAGEGTMGKIKKAFNGMMESQKHLQLANSSELKKYAEKQGVTIYQYVNGIVTGQMKTPKLIEMEEQRRIMEEQRRQREAQLAAQQAQRLAAQPRVDPVVGYLQRRGDTTPQYSGGVSSSCCGNCRFYLMGTNECGENKYRHPTGASDHCGSYRSM